MLKVGVTGGIGSGKTLVCSIFNKLGIPVFNSDVEAKNIVNSLYEVKEKIKSEFGNNIYFPDGNIDRKKLASIVFNNQKALATLNNIVHPVVRNQFMEWQKNNSSAPYVIQEAAILFESGAYKLLDKVVTVFADKKTRIKRIQKRDEASEKKIKKIIKNQMDEKMKCEKADFVLYNTEKKLLLPQIIELHKTFSR